MSDWIRWNNQDIQYPKDGTTFEVILKDGTETLAYINDNYQRSVLMIQSTGEFWCEMLNQPTHWRLKE